MQSMTENFVAYWLLINYPLIIGNNQWFNQQITHWLTIDYTFDVIDEICLGRYKYFRENQLHYHKTAVHYYNSNSN